MSDGAGIDFHLLHAQQQYQHLLPATVSVDNSQARICGRKAVAAAHAPPHSSSFSS